MYLLVVYKLAFPIGNIHMVVGLGKSLLFKEECIINIQFIFDIDAGNKNVELMQL